MDFFISGIIQVGCNYAPRSWAFCDGTLMPISQNQALFSLLGTNFGGDGRTNFGLPDLRGRAPVGMGQGTGLSGISQGARHGTETATLLASNIPEHTHAFQASASSGESNAPRNNDYLATSVSGRDSGNNNYTSSNSNLVSLNGIGNTGSGTAFGIVQPIIGMNYVIALQGIFPSRN